MPAVALRPSLRAAPAAPLRAHRRAPLRRTVAPRAAADAEYSPLPAVLAVAAPVAAVAGASAVIGSGAISADAVNAYFHTTAQFVFDADAAGQVPQFVKTWFHAVNMFTVLFAMGGYGAFLGWQVRAGNGGAATFGTSDTAAELHPKLMGGMTLLFLAGGQGGILFNLVQGRPVLESPHAISALAGLLLLAGNGALSTVMKGDPRLRTAHAFLGTSLMAVFAVHAALGLQLALSM